MRSLLRGFKRPLFDFTTKVNYLVIDVENNQLYAFDGSSVRRLGENIVHILGDEDFVQEHLRELVEGQFSKLDTLDEKAELAKRVIDHACEKTPGLFKGVSVYKIENGQITLHYISRDCDIS